MEKKKLKIVILTANRKGEATKSIMSAGEKKGHEMICLNPLHLYLYVSNAGNDFDKLFDGYGTNDAPKQIKAKDIDAVIPRINGKTFEFGLSVLEHFYNNLGIFCTQSPDGLRIASEKMLSLQKTRAKGINTPRTVMVNNPKHIKFLVDLVTPDADPYVKAPEPQIIMKTNKGSQGNGVMILKGEQSINSVMQTFAAKKIPIIIQQKIDTGLYATDIRAIVINNKVVVAMERTGQKNEFRANISQSGTGKKIELTEEEQKLAVNAANAIGLTVCGVDMLRKDYTKQLFIIEQNGCYGYKVEKITKTDISTPLIEYCEEQYLSGNQNKEANNFVTNGLWVDKQKYNSINKKADQFDDEIKAQAKELLLYLRK